MTPPYELKKLKEMDIYRKEPETMAEIERMKQYCKEHNLLTDREWAFFPQFGVGLDAEQKYMRIKIQEYDKAVKEHV
jgi:hypothetical protein